MPPARALTSRVSQAGLFGGTTTTIDFAPVEGGMTVQQAVAAGKPTLGFLNPTLYALGGGANYHAEGQTVMSEIAEAAAGDSEVHVLTLPPDAVFLGTDGTERWDLTAFRAFAHPYFAKGKAWSFRSVRRKASRKAGS